MKVAVLGLGEAGRFYAEGLADLGADVVGFDPATSDAPRRTRLASSIAEAVADADLVLSIVGVSAADAVLADALSGMSTTAVFADLNTGSPDRKVALAARAAAAGIPFADVAIMAPVPRAGVMTPVLVSGPAADRVTEFWAGLGIPVSNVGEVPGNAASLKLLRSVFMKGLAALVFESVSAAERAGADAWMREQMAGELGEGGAALIDRLLDGTRLHAARREHEMRDADDYLGTLETPTWMTQGAIQWLHALATNPAFPRDES